MFHSFFVFFCLLLITAGLFFTFYLLIFSGAAHNDNFFIVVEAYEENSTLTDDVYAAFIQANLLNFSSKKPVYVIDRNLSGQTRERIKNTVAPYGEIKFIKADTEEKLFL